MKNGIGPRGIVIFGVLLLALYSLWPSIQVHRLSGEAKQLFMKQNPKVVDKAVNFGLDLAGGTNIVVEIDKSGLKPDEAADAQERSLEIIRNRVDQFGLSEPVITPSGTNRVVAELAGVDADAAKGLIGETALLEFKLVVKQERFVPVLNQIDEYLKRKAAGVSTDTAAIADTTKKDSATVPKNLTDDQLLLGGTALKDSTAKDTTKVVAQAPVDTSKKVGPKDRFTEDLETFKKRPFSSMLRAQGGDVAVLEGDIVTIKNTLTNPGVMSLIPLDVQFAWGRNFETLENGDKVKKLYMLKRRAEMDGKEISDAKWSRVDGGLSSGQLAVNMKFKGLGPKKFASITGNNVGRQMAIVLDDQVISAPVIRDRIADGNAQITGLDDVAEAKQLSVVLRAGALPAPMKIVELRSVGASLGEDNIRNGVFSALAGIIIVLAFMIIYYKTAGLVANVAVLFNIVLLGALMSMFNGTLTLPGIAGIVLTVAMAVDANVIIYERIREEQRAGKSARQSVASGYDRAFSTIFDSNITTFLTALILYKIGTGPVKGFGMTLMIGIAASMFTALTVTRSIFDGMLARSESNKLNVGKGLEFFVKANFPVVANRRYFIGISAAVVTLSILIVAIKGFEYSVDFTGGHVLTVQFQDDVAHAKDLQAALTKGEIRDAKVRTLGGTSANQYLISASAEVDGDSKLKGQIGQALQDAGLKAEIINEEIVGPSIGKELRIDAILSVFLACLVIGLYIWLRFGKFGLGFGIGAVLALAHDVTITLGVFALFGLPIDAALIAAVLTIIGYSINDTIIVFDRIRENTQTLAGHTFAERMNLAINQTLSRTLITSLTVLFITVILAISGGSSIQDFGIAMSIGVVVGTWSSVFIASPLVLWWTERFPSRKA
jgi:SecD/SecF fusion protein